MNEMINETAIKEKITEAMREPSVSAEFVERMVVRADAITRGREAEKKLAADGDRLAADAKKDLAAAGVIGRVMQTQKPPRGVTVDVMTESLKAQPSFAAFAAAPAANILHSLQTGTFSRALTGSVPQHAPAADADKKLTVSDPELKAPSIGAKSL